MDAADHMPDAATIAAIEKDIATYNERRRRAEREIGEKLPMGLLLVGIAGVLLMAAILIYVEDGELMGRLLAVLAGGVFFAAIAVNKHVRKVGEETRQQFRDHLLPVLLGFVDGFRYRYGWRPGSLDRIPDALKGRYNKEEVQDIITGRLGDVSFELFELALKRTSKNSELVLFKGVVLSCPVRFAFPGTLIVLRHERDAFRPLREFFAGSGLETTLSRTRLDHSYEFRSDRPEAVAEAMRGRLFEVLDWLDRTWRAGSPRVALRQAHLYVMLPSQKDFFELPPLDRVLYWRDLEPLVREFAALLAIVAEMQKAPAPEAALATPPSPTAAAPSVESVEPPVTLLDPVPLSGEEREIAPPARTAE